jgi:hypothetical protein
MSIFGERRAQGSYEDARWQQSQGQQYGSLHACGTCKREIWPANSLPGITYRSENYCSCVRVQSPQEKR